MDVTEPLPPLAEFLRWLADLPAVCRTLPKGFPVTAVVADLWETLFDSPADADFLKRFRPANTGAGERNGQRRRNGDGKVPSHSAPSSRSE